MLRLIALRGVRAQKNVAHLQHIEGSKPGSRAFTCITFGKQTNHTK